MSFLYQSIIASRIVKHVCLFVCFRQLDCARVSIHKNLFLTYILNGIVWIIEYKAIVTEGQVLLENPVRFFHSLYIFCFTSYFIACQLEKRSVVAFLFKNTDTLTLFFFLFLEWGGVKREKLSSGIQIRRGINFFETNEIITHSALNHDPYVIVPLFIK